MLFSYGIQFFLISAMFLAIAIATAFFDTGAVGALLSVAYAWVSGFGACALVRVLQIGWQFQSSPREGAGIGDSK